MTAVLRSSRQGDHSCSSFEFDAYFSFVLNSQLGHYQQASGRITWIVLDLTSLADFIPTISFTYFAKQECHRHHQGSCHWSLDFRRVLPRRREAVFQVVVTMASIQYILVNPHHVEREPLVLLENQQIRSQQIMGNREEEERTEKKEFAVRFQTFHSCWVSRRCCFPMYLIKFSILSCHSNETSQHQRRSAQESLEGLA